jgi:hypothetical protein
MPVVARVADEASRSRYALRRFEDMENAREAIVKPSPSSLTLVRGTPNEDDASVMSHESWGRQNSRGLAREGRVGEQYQADRNHEWICLQ